MKRVVVTGLGIISCIGNDQNSVVNNLKNLNSGISSAIEYEEYSFRSLVHGKPDINLEDKIDRRILRFISLFIQSSEKLPLIKSKNTPFIVTTQTSYKSLF